MSKLYLSRIIAIYEMLDNPLIDDYSEETSEKASELLFKLWINYKDDVNFTKELDIISQNHPIVMQKLESLIQQSQVGGNKTMKPVDVFISYAHKDEIYKDELIKMLSPLQDQGILKIWQDREIEPGQEWFQAIRTAMNACDIALLLISSDFLDSRFIKGVEIPNLLKRRREEGLKVIPIIIRSCLWQSVPILKDLQALPKDGKPVASFEGKDDKDRVWVDIATAIKDLC